jgi:hypothetical protein
MRVSSLPAGNEPSRSRAASTNESEARVGWMNNNVEGRVAVESNRIGAGGDRLLAQITGLDEKTIKRGRQELAGELAERPEQRVRLPGGGRPRAEKKTQH